MTAFLQLVGQVQGPFRVNIHPSQSDTGWTSVERLMALFEDVEPDEHPVYIDNHWHWTFGKCLFGYEEGQPVLDRFTAAFHPGSSTAIAGPTEQEKRPLSGLILALVYPEKGRIDLTTDDGRTLSVTPIYASTSSMCPKEIRCWAVPSGSLWLGSPGADEEALHKSLAGLRWICVQSAGRTRYQDRGTWIWLVWRTSPTDCNSPRTVASRADLAVWWSIIGTWHRDHHTPHGQFVAMGKE